MADVSLDQPLYEGGEETMMDTVKTDVNVENMVEERRRTSDSGAEDSRVSGKLSERELYIFEHRIMTDEPMTLQEIGDHFSISRERAGRSKRVSLPRFRRIS